MGAVVGLTAQMSVCASGCPSHGQTLGSSAGSPAFWFPPAHTAETKDKSVCYSGSDLCLIHHKLINTRAALKLLSHVSHCVFSQIESLYFNLVKYLSSDLLQLLLPLAQLRLQVGGPLSGHLLLLVQLQPALLQHSFQLRLLLQQ